MIRKRWQFDTFLSQMLSRDNPEHNNSGFACELLPWSASFSLPVIGPRKLKFALQLAVKSGS
jgi:hypothetical protein